MRAIMMVSGVRGDGVLRDLCRVEAVSNSSSAPRAKAN